MKGTVKTPKSLLEAVRMFADQETAWQYAVELRWPNGVKCPFCGSDKHSFLSTRHTWQCKECSKQFSVKKGTIFEDSPIKLDKWLIAMWLIANAKNGISSYELHRSLEVTQKTAWFMLHRIRLAMQNGSIEKLGGKVEADETYIGGKITNMHQHRQMAFGPTKDNKIAVMGLLERYGDVRAFIVPNTKIGAIQTAVRANVDKGSYLFTDALGAYKGLKGDYRHEFVSHMGDYVRGEVHTNSLENFWSLLKRTLKGTYISVEPFHLFRYLDEQAFRYNNRKLNDGQRFDSVGGSVSGKRLTYKALIGKESAAA